MRWVKIKGFEESYEISDTGLVKSISSGKVLKLSVTPRGYLRTSLSNGKVKNFFVHRLVAIAFVDNPHNKGFVNHKDCDKKNNHADNLEWVTPKENTHHAWQNGLMTNTVKYGEDHPAAKLTDQQLAEVRERKLPNKELALKFGVSKNAIKSYLYNRKTRRSNPFTQSTN